MQRSHPKIGFNDWPLIIAGVVIIPFIIPFVFFGARINRPPYFNWSIYWVSAVTTAIIWIGCRFIMIWARGLYPDFAENKRRLYVQSASMLGFTLLANNVTGFLLKDVCLQNYPSHSNTDIILDSNFAAIFCTLVVVAIYETIYFKGELRRSIEEKELLKRENLVGQLNALKAQVNPHFLFNSLNTLCAIIPEQPTLAIEFVQRLSKIYRHILEVKNAESIPLKDELEVLEAYAFMLKIRFGENLAIDIHVGEEKLNQRIVPLSLQILMENAIQHNIVSATRPLRIEVFSENGNLVVCNNLQKKNQSKESTGIGLDNIRNRYKLLGGKQVKVTEEAESFSVSIPLIANEDSHH
jgi:hypothetical protein